MTTAADLQARVAARYQTLDLPSWPDPHRGMTSPRDEEYSRVTDPGRYRIVHARGRAWSAVLEESLGARREPCDPSADMGEKSAAFDRGVRLTPDDADALPLLILESDVSTQAGQPTLASLSIAVVRPDVVVAREPDCGCDACDSGSDDLLRAIDEAITRVVAGPTVVLRGDTWHAEWHPDAFSASSAGRQAPDFNMLRGLCRQLAEGEDVALPRGTDAFVGTAWVG